MPLLRSRVLNTLLLNTLTACTSFKLRDQVSQPFNITGNIIVSYIDGLAHKHRMSKVHDFEITQVEFLKFHLLHQESNNSNFELVLFPIIWTYNTCTVATVYEEQLETKFSRESENVFILSLYYYFDGIGVTSSSISVKETVVACSIVE